MLPRKNLIALRKEFAKIRKEGKMFDSPSFGLIVTYNKQQTTNNPRVAFIVSKKISLKSVVRHEVKRKLADAVSPLLRKIPANTQLTLLAKQKAIETSREDLVKELELILRRERILR